MKTNFTIALKLLRFSLFLSLYNFILFSRLKVKVHESIKISFRVFKHLSLVLKRYF